MGRKPGFIPLNKIRWSKKMTNFLIKNYQKMNNRELADGLGLKITAVRMRLYELGYKRIEMEYWTRPQINYLIKYYKTIGDKELAEIFNKKWEKQKGWSHKHIEKKRKYLNLKRSPRQIKAIHQRNVDAGRFLLCPVKRWATTGQAKEGEVRMWREQSGRFTPRIKIGGRFVHWNRWRWEKKYGPVPKGMNVVFKDNNPQNRTLRNLMLLSDADMARRNVAQSSKGLSDNYLAGLMSHKDLELRSLLKTRPDLLDFKRQQLLIERQIRKHEKQDQRSA